MNKQSKTNQSTGNQTLDAIMAGTRRYRAILDGQVVATMYRINSGQFVISNLNTDKHRWFNDFDAAFAAINRMRHDFVEAYNV